MEVGDPRQVRQYAAGSTHISRKRDQIKMRDYVDRRVTPP